MISNNKELTGLRIVVYFRCAVLQSVTVADLIPTRGMQVRFTQCGLWLVVSG